MTRLMVDIPCFTMTWRIGRLTICVHWKDTSPAWQFNMIHVVFMYWDVWWIHCSTSLSLSLNIFWQFHMTNGCADKLTKWWIVIWWIVFSANCSFKSCVPAVKRTFDEMSFSMLANCRVDDLSFGKVLLNPLDPTPLFKTDR